MLKLRKQKINSKICNIQINVLRAITETTLILSANLQLNNKNKILFIYKMYVSKCTAEFVKH